MISFWFWGAVISGLVILPVLHLIIDQTAVVAQDRDDGLHFIVAAFWFISVPFNILMALIYTLGFFRDLIVYKARYYRATQEDMADRYCKILSFLSQKELIRSQISSYGQGSMFIHLPENDEENFKIQIAGGQFDFALIRFIGVYEEQIPVIMTTFESAKKAAERNAMIEKKRANDKQKSLSRFEELKRKVSNE